MRVAGSEPLKMITPISPLIQPLVERSIFFLAASALAPGTLDRSPFQ